MPASKKPTKPKAPKRAGGPSSSGFHFFDLYGNCPRKFFIRYHARILPKYLDAALPFGTAFHEGKATFYNTKSITRARSTALRVLKSMKNQYEFSEDFDLDLFRAPILLEMWAYKFGFADLKSYKILGVERLFEIPLPRTKGYKITGRMDLIVEDAHGDIYIYDTKTSNSSWRLTEMGLYNGDQATTYIWAAKKLYPGRNIGGLIGDIAYWNRKAKDETNVRCYRTDLITRSNQDLADFEYSTADTITEIAQRSKAYKSGKYPAAIFPRRTFYCNAYFRECEYMHICRTNITMSGRAPFGFIRDPSKKPTKITDLTTEVT
jgi:hypothetical protein